MVKLAIMGPGDELYFWWGHIGIIIEDYGTNKSRFYDWGIFSFDNDNFYRNFAFGRLLYTCDATSPEWNYRSYISHDRDITLYTLDLSAEKKKEIQRFAEWNILPENKDYYYNQFWDNCATRVRDIVDTALDGQFREKYENTPGRFSLRQHIRRHTWFSPFYDWILNFWLGRVIDRPISVWDEMFLPSEIALRIQEYSYADPDGKEHQLVSSVETIFNSTDRPAVLDTPRRQWPRELVAGCAAALVFAMLLFFRSRDNSAAHIVWALSQGGVGLFFGAAGSALFFMMFFTNHDYTYYNNNILFVNPLLLGALPLGILYCCADSPQKKFKWEYIIKTLWSWVFFFGIVCMLMNIFPVLRQQNKVDLALIMPAAAVLSWFPDLLVYIRREYLWRWLN